MSFFSEHEIQQVGFGGIGSNVKISKKASIYNPQNIYLGNDVRIDDFCILSAGKEIIIGNNVHIAVYSSLIGSESIIIYNYANISSRVSIYSSTDDFSGESLTNPTIPDRFKKVVSLPVLIKKHVIIGSGSTILPGVTLETGVAVGAMSLIKDSYAEFQIVAGIPAKLIGMRSQNLLSLEKEYDNAR